MITFLASPKPFTGLALEQQMAAITSWRALHDDVEVLLYGDAAGMEQACSAAGAVAMPEIAVNEFGTPLFGAIVEHARTHGRHDLQVYLNCDIMLTPEFLTAIGGIRLPHFLLVGSRLNVPRGCDIDIRLPDWRNCLRDAARQGRVHLQYPVGSDYFGFRRGMWQNLAPITIGRAGYDNALFAYCLKRAIPIIDATPAVIALHHDHQYEHVSGGATTVWWGEESRRNRVAAGPGYALPTLEDAGWLLCRDRLERNHHYGDRLRTLEARLRYEWKLSPLAWCVRVLRRLLGQTNPERARRTPLPVLLDECFGGEMECECAG